MASRKAQHRFQWRFQVQRNHLVWSCVCVLIVLTCASHQHRSEAEKQSAFEQLIAKGSRLRWLAQPATTLAPSDGHHRGNQHRDDGEHESAVGPPTSASLDVLIKDEPVKRHDRRHANSSIADKKKKDHAKRQHHAGRHVCTHEETVTRPVRVVESYCKPAYKSFTQRCSNGTTLCTAFRVQYDTIYRTVVKYQTTTEKRHACCPGWTHTSKHTHGCPQAVCSKGCKNGGTCVKPDTCACLPGYTGSTCETDVDECANSNLHRCQQNCINAVGSYQCTCHDGFHLQEDNRTCKFPELQNLLLNYEAMSKRLTAMEHESRERSSTHPPAQAVVGQQVDILEYQTTIANMTQHIFALEEKLSRLESETKAILAKNSNSIETMESSNSDSLTSLSEQVAILEERLADCTCTSTRP